MPLARYFFLVGTALLTLLFVVDAYLPKLPPVEKTTAAVDLSVIRIHSDRKWPERIVLDPSIPTIVPAPVRTAQTNPSTPTSIAEVPEKARSREAFAELQPSNPAQIRPADPGKPEPRPQPQRKRRTVARTYIGPPAMQVAQQPRFGFFANNIW
jgi:hypothetical protein